jgi:hypothetical protein
MTERADAFLGRRDESRVDENVRPRFSAGVMPSGSSGGAPVLANFLSAGEEKKRAAVRWFQPQESPDGRYLFYLDRPPGGAAIVARLMRIALGGGQEEPVLEHVRPFLWSVTDAGIVFVTREPELDAIDRYRFSDRRVARVGRLGFRIPGIWTHMSVSRDGRWALSTKMERFDSDLRRLDNFR